MSILTNRLFINTMLDPDDVTKILRVWKWYCDKKLDPKAPIWVKEDMYEVWLDEPFDNRAWAMASTPYAKGTIPKDFARSIRWAYKMSEREEKPKKRGVEMTDEEYYALYRKADNMGAIEHA